MILNKRRLLVLSHNELCEASDLAKVEAYFAQFGISVMWIKDHPALLTAPSLYSLMKPAKHVVCCESGRY